MKFEDVIKEYLTTAIESDPALKAAYSESKITGCCNYIKSQAKKQAQNGCAAIEDADVYKWARDYMYGDTTEEVEAPQMEECEVTTFEEPPARPKASKPKVEKKEEISMQLEMF